MVFKAFKPSLIKLTLFFLLVFSITLFSQDLQELVNSKAPQGCFVGVYFQDVEDGTIIYKQNEHNLFIPASLTKIFTTLAAWDILGPDFRYTTTVYVPIGVISPILKGDVVIKGNGDPSMSVDILKNNLRKFVTEGVKEIQGDIIIDNSFFSDERWGVGWEWDYKNPSVDALILREYVNSFDPKSKNAVALHYGSQVIKILQSYGIKVTGSAKVGKLPASYREFIVIKSPPLKTLIEISNKLSSNSYAEQILRTLGLRVYNLGSISNSIKVVNDFYKKLFGDFYPFRLNDGCGLSTYNITTPYMVATTLAYAYKNYGGLEGFISTLSVAGKDGTLQNRLKDITLYGKTGTLQRVSNVAGIMITRTGRKLAFCIMLNNFVAPTYTAMAYQDEIIRFVWNNY
uniref:D-alanyl-D-alanine carboxypeptidase n=1 Tax=Fervidobacterium nodosum TaxID=2424 RepID=A0A7C5Y2Q0_9BACT